MQIVVLPDTMRLITKLGICHGPVATEVYKASQHPGNNYSNYYFTEVYKASQHPGNNTQL